jgi:nucleoid DNA-binding protein
MKTFWKLLGIATLVAVLGVMAVGAVALAQEDDGDGTFDFRERVHEAIADALGISAEEYDAAVDTAHDQVLDEAVAEGALTQEQADAIKERQELGYGPRMGNRGGFLGPRGGMGAGGWMGGPENSLIAVAAEQLGMTLEELVTALEDGETTIADLATAQGVDPQAIADAYIAARADLLAQAVADGRITQSQADLMLEHMEEEVAEHLSEPFPFGNRGFGGGPGGCWGSDETGSSFGRGRMGGGMGPGRFQNQDVPGSSDL